MSAARTAGLGRGAAAWGPGAPDPGLPGPGLFDSAKGNSPQISTAHNLGSGRVRRNIRATFPSRWRGRRFPLSGKALGPGATGLGAYPW